MPKAHFSWLDRWGPLGRVAEESTAICSLVDGWAAIAMHSRTQMGEMSNATFNGLAILSLVLWYIAACIIAEQSFMGQHATPALQCIRARMVQKGPGKF